MATRIGAGSGAVDRTHGNTGPGADRADARTGTIDRRCRLALIIDDDAGFARELADMLDSSGFRPLRAATANEGRAQLERGPVALAVIEMHLPDEPGSEFIGAYDPIEREFATVLVSRQPSESDRIAGLEAGAEDSINKPVSLRELGIRIRNALTLHDGRVQAPLRRGTATHFGPWRLYPSQQRIVHTDGTEHHLSAGERNLLLELQEANGEPLAREYLLIRCLGAGSKASPRVIDVLVSQLRNKLGCTRRSPYIVTITGVGYAWYTN